MRRILPGSLRVSGSRFSLPPAARISSASAASPRHKCRKRRKSRIAAPPERQATRYRIAVRLDSGSSLITEDTRDLNLPVGDRMRIEDGHVYPIACGNAAVDGLEPDGQEWSDAEDEILFDAAR